jgi:hypothetical protein
MFPLAAKPTINEVDEDAVSSLEPDIASNEDDGSDSEGEDNFSPSMPTLTTFATKYSPIIVRS